MINGQQEFLQVGSRFQFQRKAEGDQSYPLIDLGTVETINPEINTTEAELKDGWGGRMRTVAKSVTEQTETYQITCSNFSMENMALLFAASPPQDYTQDATAVTGATATGIVGGLIKVVDDNSEPVYNLTSIDGVDMDPSGTSTSLVEDDDYEVVDLKLGTIRLLPGGSSSLTRGNEVDLGIDYTPAAISGLRLINPQTADSVDGKGFVYWSGDNHQHMWVRHADVSISPNSANFQTDDFSNFQINVTVLNDPSNVDNPAGELLKFRGPLPTR